MSDRFPSWPDDWLDDHSVATEQVVAEAQGVRLTSGLRSDGQILMSLAWPEGRRYMRVDPIGNERPSALRVGEKRADDPEVNRIVEGLWSQALALAKQIVDGELTGPPGAQAQPGRRRWGRQGD